MEVIVFMRLIDIAKNIDKSENNECWVELEVLQQELELPQYGYAEQERLKAYWVDNWYCTDSWVGGRIYFFDDEPVAYSYQKGRKCSEEFAWFSQEAAEKVRSFVQGLHQDKLRVSICNVNEDIGDSYKLSYASQVLDWNKARYHGEPVLFAGVYNPTGKPHFLDDDRVQIQRTGSENILVVCMEELDFLFHVNDGRENEIEGSLDDLIQNAESLKVDQTLENKGRDLEER